ncbi:MAG TPA: TGS domain-containing protein, partial [Clostridia bacterium]|nr:TGS domain-containing protein [Clostridia bacterium]
MEKLIKIKLPDGSERSYQAPVTSYDVASDISKGLAKKALLAEVNGKLVDLNQPILEDGTLQIITVDDPRALEVLRHSTAHIMAQAVKRLYPEAKLAIGPAIDNGFYYDFDVEKPFSPAELEKITAEMEKIVEEDYPFERIEISREDAIKFFEEKGEQYKVELIKDLPVDAPITLYKQGDFVDLCLGPHIPSTKLVKAFKLMSVAGAYWRGSEKNKMLQRIYGTSFFKKKDLDEYLYRLEEAVKRDHRKLGKELDLFSIQEEGPGFPFFHPKGMVIRNELEAFWRKEHIKRGYQEIKTPIILSEELWRQSGHWDHYKENMYFTKIDDQDYAIKPMNCPGSI